MPEEDKTKIEQEDPDAVTEDKKSLSIKKYGIYGLIVIVVVAAAYFVTLKVVKPMFADSESSSEAVSKKTSKAETKKSKKERKAPGGPESAEHASGDIYMIDDIIVNPAGTGGRRFLSTSVGFELRSAEASDLFTEREAIVRDALITILSSQSIPELSDFKQREKLRRLIELRVQKLLHTEDIKAVYFTEFVLQ